MGKEVILNIIREVSKFDFVDYPNKKKHQKMQNLKLFFINPSKIKQIFQKFQGVQYYASKNEAKKALEERHKLTIYLKEKKGKI